VGGGGKKKREIRKKRRGSERIVLFHHDRCGAVLVSQSGGPRQNGGDTYETAEKG